MGAAGPSQFLVCVNGRIKVFSKTGVPGSLNASTDNFFASVTSHRTTDPRVRYDRLSRRWLIVMIDVPNSRKNNQVLIAVSSGPVITDSSSFTFYSFVHSDAAPAGDNNLFADYPTLGIDRHALYIGVNLFSSAFFNGTSAYVINKADLLAGNLTLRAFRQIGTASSGPYTPQGADNDDPAAAEGYFIGVDAQQKGRLHLRRVSNPGGTPTLSGNIVITVPATSNPMGGVFARDSSIALDDLDDRLMMAQVKNGSLWTTHNIEVDASGTASASGGRDGSRWYEIIDLSGTPTLRQAGTLFDPRASTPASYWIPSLAVSGQGHMVLGCSVAGTTQYAEIAVASRIAGDALGTLRTPFVAQISSSAYNINDGRNPHRWGDYSFTCVDPNDDSTIWTVQEYCDAPNSWGVRVIQLRAPPPALPVSCTPNSLSPGMSNVTLTITGVSSNGSGFFDPGPTFSNRINAAISGSGLVVNTVGYNNPTNITLNVTVLASATNGPRAIIVTNPDGQTLTSTSGILSIAGGRPVILAINRTATNVSLQWSAIPGSTYRIQATESLDNATWMNLLGPVVATNVVATAVDSNPATTQRFYRVRSEP